MGAYSTSPLHAVSESDSGATESTRTGWATVSRVAAWFIFLVGLVATVLGIAGLRVEITVAGLILACTAGLILLKLRADSHGSA
ncbi:hypothetical protein IU494_09165 [Nocardia terpenica]|uniref:hypothetical protein n=1 Tax=Nocardia terpenica TaxID=455432 RepID=UPI000830FE88|nr:hypothetical protein [Nocardia terpenica]MBF6060949.1 hypothetical protein [Nocardia terpenica]MBF6111417.1 hypothetical protein [Nocardia terpenica]MBF6118430.1 hypothetical protein [Nocardia terpenica]MBF6155752.1 hypothetical protein [Nocardia terpenica]NQE90672.1 hypothetical protein [Nocardia terpenica]